MLLLLTELYYVYVFFSIITLYYLYYY